MKIFRGCVQAVRQLEGVSELLAVTLASKNEETCSGPKQGCSVGLETVSVRLKHGFVQIVRPKQRSYIFPRCSVQSQSMKCQVQI
jgi:hypothetical protein